MVNSRKRLITFFVIAIGSLFLVFFVLFGGRRESHGEVILSPTTNISVEQSNTALQEGNRPREAAEALVEEGTLGSADITGSPATVASIVPVPSSKPIPTVRTLFERDIFRRQESDDDVREITSRGDSSTYCWQLVPDHVPVSLSPSLNTRSEEEAGQKQGEETLLPLELEFILSSVPSIPPWVVGPLMRKIQGGGINNILEYENGIIDPGATVDEERLKVDVKLRHTILYSVILASSDACAALCLYELVNQGGKPCVAAVYDPGLRVCYLKGSPPLTLSLGDGGGSSAADSAARAGDDVSKEKAVFFIPPDYLYRVSCETASKESVTRFASKRNLQSSDSKAHAPKKSVIRSLELKAFPGMTAQSGHDLMLTVYLSDEECRQRCDMMRHICMGVVVRRSLCFLKSTVGVLQEDGDSTSYFRLFASETTSKEGIPPAHSPLRLTNSSGPAEVSFLSSSVAPLHSPPSFQQVINQSATNSYTGEMSKIKYQELTNSLDEAYHGTAVVSSPFKPHQLSGLIFGVLVSAASLYERLLPALDTWLYDVDCVLFVEQRHFRYLVRILAKWQRKDRIGLRARVFSLAKDKSDRNSVGGAWKNLLIMEQLYNLYPERAWYGIADDDTFILQHNLQLLMERYDLMPGNRPWYLGVLFSSNDNPEDSINFAQGGAGYVYNQAAAKMVHTNLVSGYCHQMCKKWWAGDIRSSCCFRLSHVLPTHQPEFWSMTPFNAVGRDRRDSRTPMPVSFHQLRRPTWVYDLFWASTAEGLWKASSSSRRVILQFFTGVSDETATSAMEQALDLAEHGLGMTNSRHGLQATAGGKQKLSFSDRLIGPVPGYSAPWAFSPQWVGCRQLRAWLLSRWKSQQNEKEKQRTLGAQNSSSDESTSMQTGGVDLSGFNPKEEEQGGFLCNYKLGQKKLKWSAIKIPFLSRWKGLRYQDKIYSEDGYNFVPLTKKRLEQEKEADKAAQ